MNAITARDLAGRLNLKKYPRSWRGCCPSCNYPGATFSVREGKNGHPLLWCANGCQRDHLADAVNRVMGLTWTPPERSDQQGKASAHKQASALRLWSGSVMASGTLADRYLTSRGLPELAASAALRFRGDTPHPEYARLPAMIALVSDMAATPIAIHRTYLSGDGSKARVEPAKASLGPAWGGAIRLDPFEPGKPLVLGEGVESSASAGILMGLPAWAAISCGNLARGLELPEEVRSVIIAADPDEAGGRAAVAAALRWRTEGRTVRIARPTGHGDFNDVLRSRKNG
jgi:putative DNA primase/helicase